MFKVKRVMSLDILTPDVGRMVGFYHGTLGVPFFMPWDGNEDLAALDAGNFIICLMRTTSTTAPPTHTALDMGVGDPQGFDSIAFEVDDLDEAIAALEGRVKWLLDEPFEYREPNGTYFRNRAMHDPDGNMVYVQEPHIVSEVPAPTSVVQEEQPASPSMSVEGLRLGHCAMAVRNAVEAHRAIEHPARFDLDART